MNAPRFIRTEGHGYVNSLYVVRIWVEQVAIDGPWGVYLSMDRRISENSSCARVSVHDLQTSAYTKLGLIITSIHEEEETEA